MELYYQNEKRVSYWKVQIKATNITLKYGIIKKIQVNNNC